jgi:sialate O-acetylesterase
VIGFELCDAVGQGCRWADARIDGARVVLTVPAGAPAARVRFAWADSPTFNLFDTEGLPAGPFEMAVN